jgi:AraC-like DNA-binding protein/quercetin dioxygenase-like cupin family protein
VQQRTSPVEVALPDYGVFVLESRHAPGFRMAASRHDFLEVFYVLDGAGTFAVGRRSDACSAGDLVVVPAGEPHRITDSPAGPLSLYAICAAPAVCRVEPGATVLPAGRLAHPDRVSGPVRDALRQMLFEQTMARPGHRATLVGLTLQILGLIVRGTASKTRTAPDTLPASTDSATAVRQYVEELTHHFFEPTHLDAAAAGLGLSRRRFTELFRSATGTTWLDHLTGLRVNYAAQLLRDTPRSVTAVAFESGFEDLSSFYRAFKKRMGSPPNEWRQRQHS